MKEEICKISSAEWFVMKVLWGESPLTASEIIEKLKLKSSWSPKTIHSLIDRLVNKGALRVDKEAAQYRFFPLLSQEDCVKDETKSFLKKVYDGSFYLMVANFIKDENMSPSEIDKLKQILEKAEEKDGR
jgi:BlaI family transcriptional regulator, penicillinase repressor